MNYLKRKLNDLKQSIRKNKAERQALGADFDASMTTEIVSYSLPVGLICIFAWLGFAFDTDPVLHPEFPDLLYFRLGLTAIGLAITTLSFIRKPELIFLSIQILAIYATFSCAFFTGRIADDANYVSGFQIILFIIAFAPFRRKFYDFLLLASAVIFVAGVLIAHPKLGTPQVKYSMNNLFIVYIFSWFLSFFLDRFRFRLFKQHREMEALKIKQDGDYFLTSLLLDPLSRGGYHGENLAVNIKTDQHKKFSFRKWTAEIGGDFCNAGPLQLNGREYTVFINADAMGKSMQGAGGTLVLGTVFKSLLNRNAKTEAEKSMYPEQWLKRCFMEIQDVFVAFEGSMLISAVIGLVDTETGVLYYLNAEHPWCVLYRDGKAEFIENDLHLRKIGVHGNEEGFFIKTFQLEEGDIFILGSDGRDDIIISEGDEGFMNQDENLFLKTVERASGNIDRIHEILHETGETTDDISLLAVRYNRKRRGVQDPGEVEERIRKAGPEELLNLVPVFETLIGNQRLALKLYRNYMKQGFIRQAFDLCRIYSNNNPAETEFLYLTSYAAKIMFSRGRKREYLNIAADFGERCRLRSPAMARNLLNLANVYLLSGNKERAGAILNDLMLIEPDNGKVRVLLDHLGEV